MNPQIRRPCQFAQLGLVLAFFADSGCVGSLEVIERATGLQPETHEESSSSTTAGGAEHGGSVGPEGCSEVRWYEDLDGDGFGRNGATPITACDAPLQHVDNDDDCDDSSPAVHPDAVEHCDQVDNDCDTAIDEWSSANTACGECLYEQFGDRIYYRCEAQVTWTDAVAYCKGRGAELVSGLNAELNRELAGLGGAPAHWIGLSDREREGHFVWLNSEDSPIDGWAVDQPDGGPGDADCVVLRQDGTWHDEACETSHSVFCAYAESSDVVRPRERRKHTKRAEP